MATPFAAPPMQLGNPELPLGPPPKVKVPEVLMLRLTPRSSQVAIKIEPTEDADNKADGKKVTFVDTAAAGPAPKAKAPSRKKTKSRN